MRLDLLLFAVLASLIVGFGGGWTTRSWKSASDETIVRTAVDATRADQEEILHQHSAALEQIRLAIETRQTVTVQKIREIYRDRPVPSADCAVPDDVRGLLVSLVRGNAPSSGESGGAVPAASGTSGVINRPATGGVGGDDNRAVPPVPGEAEEPR